MPIWLHELFNFLCQASHVQRLMKLIRFRNTHQAFQGEFSVLESSDDQVCLRWQQEHVQCRLTVNLGTYQSIVHFTDDSGELAKYIV
ncbi:hypothetical protein DFQ00_101267 [Paenibacillus barcinonensis]|nr:hypothetical protein [Paenibacillus barcinonensis]PYE52334.1 hypothetical protein DFQ00_101267 [Paenibacillus barcinonensis]